MSDPCCVRFGLGLQAQVFKTIYMFDLEVRLMPDVLEWLEENQVEVVSLDIDGRAPAETCLIARFATPDQAMLFRMRWL